MPAFRQRVENRPKIHKAAGQGAVWASVDLYPFELHIGPAGRFAKEVDRRTVRPSMRIDILPGRRALESNAVRSLAVDSRMP
jgi:hypothetical protein